MISQHFTEEHELLRRQVRRFVETELAPHAEAWEAAQSFPREVFTRMGELGFLGIRYPEEIGGQGLDIFSAVAFAEELVGSGMAGLNMAILVQAHMATPVIAAIGNEYQKQTFLAPAIRGEKIAALGISEPGCGSDVAAIATRAVRDGDEYVVNGAKTFITNGMRADFITLAVRTGDEPGFGGLSLLLFDTKTPGFSVGKALRKMGNHTSDTAELHFQDCRVPVANLLGEEGMGFYYIMQNFQEERLFAAVMGYAGAQKALEMTREFAEKRAAFGRPIGKFQVIRHKMVEISTRVEAARQLTYHAAWLMSQGEVCLREITMAKLFASETSKWAVDECLQIHGGYGYIEEYPICRAYRDVRLITIGGGTSEIMREILAKLELDGIQVSPVYKSL